MHFSYNKTIDMIEKLKRTLCGACTLKVSYMLPNNQINEYKSIIRQCNGQSKILKKLANKSIYFNNRK